MYNRYIPQQLQYEPASHPGGRSRGETVGKAQGNGRETAGFGWGLGGLLGGLGGTAGDGEAPGLRGLLKALHLDDLDAGDILLALIVLLLILEDGDNLDLIITLGLMILFSLGES